MLAAATASAAILAAPTAMADPDTSCDPAVVACPGGAAAVPGNSGPNDYSPAVAPPDQYPVDGDWFFGAPGPNEPAYGNNNGPHTGGGAGHR